MGPILAFVLVVAMVMLGTAPTRIRGTVVHMSDGRFTFAGPMWAGQPSDMGDTAVLDLGDITLLITSQTAFTHDTAAFTSQGIRLHDYDLIVVKSAGHAQVSFDGVATLINARTSGVGAYTAGAFTFRRRGPTYPEDHVTFGPHPRIARGRCR